MNTAFSRQYWFLLPVVLLVAGWLRWDTYPQTYFADELIPRAVVNHMQATHSLDTNWEHADWRGDYAGGFYKLQQYNFSSYHVVLLGVREVMSKAGLGDMPDLVLYRVSSLCFQLLCLLLVFAIAARLAGARAGLWAALCLALTPQAVVDAHYARPESFVMLLVALACWLSLRACSEHNWRYTLPEAAVWGVAFACKFSFLPMIAIAFLVHLFLFRRVWVALAWCASFAAGIAVSAPYILLDIPGFLHGIGLLLHQYAANDAGAGWLHSLFPSAHQLFPYLAVFFGMPFFLVMAFVFYFEKQNIYENKKQVKYFAYLTLAISAVYIFLFARQGVFFERNLSHLLPLWAVMFAMGMTNIMHLVKARWASALILFLVFLWPVYLSFQIDRYFFRGLLVVRDNVARHDEGVSRDFLPGKVVPVNLMGGRLDAVTPDQILRIPQNKLPEMEKVNALLAEKGFLQIARYELPLSFLPYSQLHINHFPPAYIYYKQGAVMKNEGVE